jgi:hypothetical protein
MGRLGAQLAPGLATTWLAGRLRQWLGAGLAQQLTAGLGAGTTAHYKFGYSDNLL